MFPNSLCLPHPLSNSNSGAKGCPSIVQDGQWEGDGGRGSEGRCVCLFFSPSLLSVTVVLPLVGCCTSQALAWPGAHTLPRHYLPPSLPSQRGIICTPLLHSLLACFSCGTSLRLATPDLISCLSHSTSLPPPPPSSSSPCQTNAFTPGEGLEEGKAGGKSAFTPDQLAKIKAAIGAATSAADIDRLNFFVQQGVLPPELQEAAGAGAGAGAGGDGLEGGGEAAAAESAAPAVPSGAGDADLD